ncbi:MAG: hypothetical protein QG554_2269 [Pseudomonadota bacterium]|jgi:hypothetical protein|nr:hypothetical protein [Pseudomonadota bacterium]
MAQQALRQSTFYVKGVDLGVLACTQSARSASGGMRHLQAQRASVTIEAFMFRNAGFERVPCQGAVPGYPPRSVP